MTAAAQTVTSDGAPYVTALMAGELFADPAYQRDVDPRRVARMAAAFDRRLLGVLEVSDRGDDRYAILDGQHRHALVLYVLDDTAVLVCQVYAGLSIEDEARLFHEVNARRKQLTFWDRWKSRRAAGEPAVAAIEDVLARHELRVHPAHEDGCVAATSALEAIVQLGGVTLLDETVTVLRLAYGPSRAAFEGAVLHGLAVVINHYRAELEFERLEQQLSNLPVRQLRARALALREAHRGTLPRLVAAVIVEQYNRGRGPKLDPFLSLPTATIAAAAPPRGEDPHVASARVRGDERDRRRQLAAAGLCLCSHAEHSHDEDGLCRVCEACTGFEIPAAAE